MAEAAKTKPESGSVAAFLAGVADPQQRADCEALSRMMQLATGHEPRMWGASIVGFDQYHYRYDSGREGDAPVIAFSPRKQALTLYLGCDSPGFDVMLARLGKHKAGKICVYVKRLADVDPDALEALLREVVAERRERHPH